MHAAAFFEIDGPLDCLPGENQMRAADLGGMSRLARNLGADLQPILERYGIDSRAVHDPDALIDCAAYVNVLEHCSRSFRDPFFGLHLAQLQEADMYGAVTALCRATPTVREAIANFIEYIPVIHAPMAILELAEGKDTAELRWQVRSDAGANPQASYHATMLDLKFLRAICGSTFRPTCVQLTATVRSQHVAELERQYGCRLHAQAPTNLIGFSSSFLTRPVPSANRLVLGLLGGYLRKVKETSRNSIAQRVDSYIRLALPVGTCSVENCARKLGTSVRMLQTILNEEGLCFSDLLEHQRLELARIHLRDDALSFNEISAVLGYSEASSFSRAFKRWTRETPQAYRLAHGKRAGEGGRSSRS